MARTLVAAASAAAADAGKMVADLGGNAVDAAIAAVIASMTTELGIVSPGAGGFITIWPPDDAPVVIDAYAEMPGRGRSQDAPTATERVHLDYGGGMDTVVGWGSVAIPGAFSGFDVARRLRGRVPWSELLAPSVALAREGYTISAATAYYLQFAHELVFGWDPEASSLYHDADGRPLHAGDTARNPRLAEALELIAREGSDTLYHGEMAVALARACEERGGLVTLHDLDEYTPVVRPASRAGLRHWDIATNAPPAVGGITLTGLLTLLARMGVESWDAEGIAAYAAAQHAVFSFRRSDLDGDVDRFAGSDLLLDLASAGDRAAMHRSPSTVHTSAVDDSGLACAITVSAGYGSGAVIPGYGFGLNNSLGEIELTSEGLHALPIGNRLLSNMAPTVARSSDGEVLAIGSPGADRITSAIATVLFNHIVCGLDLEESVEAPRIHAEVFEGVPTLATEPGPDVSLVEDLLIRNLPAKSMYFGGVQVAALGPDGDLIGAADPRRSGAIRVGGS